MLKQLEMSVTATKVLNIHLKMIHVSKFEEVVMLNDELDQLVTGNEGEDQPRYGMMTVSDTAAYHGEDARGEASPGSCPHPWRSPRGS